MAAAPGSLVRVVASQKGRAHAALCFLALLACAPRPPDEDAWRAELSSWTHPAPLPSFPLVDQAGRPFLATDLRGAPTVVAFVFTRCAVAQACPLTMTLLKQAASLATGTGLQFLVLTLDPEHDTPAQLAAFARKHGVDVPGFRLATGPREVVDAMASLFNVVALRRAQERGMAQDLNHVVKVAVLDRHLVPVREWLDNKFLPKEVVDAAVGL